MCVYTACMSWECVFVGLALSMWGVLLDAADRTLPEAYTKRSCGVTEKSLELLSEGLFNTLLLFVWGHFRSV